MYFINILPLIVIYGMNTSRLLFSSGNNLSFVTKITAPGLLEAKLVIGDFLQPTSTFLHEVSVCHTQTLGGGFFFFLFLNALLWSQHKLKTSTEQ